MLLVMTWDLFKHEDYFPDIGISITKIKWSIYDFYYNFIYQ